MALCDNTLHCGNSENNYFQNLSQNDDPFISFCLKSRTTNLKHPKKPFGTKSQVS